MQSRAEPEQRHHPRARVEIAVSLTCKNDEAANHTFTIRDISLSGMAIHSQTMSPQLGDTLCLCLSEHRDQCSRDHVIEATVVHLHQEYVVIRFDSVGIHILRDIQRLLRNGRVF
jgi:c-di-GMP-binding flagellar brake protein YcgR